MATADPTLYLIDGHAQIFRAYYAIRGPLNSPRTGEPTQAIFGFAGMMLKLFSTFQPHYVVMASDSPGKTFRDDLFDQYKANRPPPPADLLAQIPRIHELTRLLGVPILAQQGVEADDLIASVVRRILNDPQRRNLQIRMVSKDKDLEQLLGPRVTMFDIQTDTLLDEKWLLAHKGITPQQVVDMLALTGDTADNVPGCPGIGPKTASELLGLYGSIEGIYAHIEQIKGKRRENLEKSRECLSLSRQLVRLKDDLDFQLDMDQAQARGIDAAGLRRFFDELGLARHASELDALLATIGDSLAQADEKKKISPSHSRNEGFADNLFEPAGVALSSTALDEPQQRKPGMSAASDFDYQAILTRAHLDELIGVLGQQKAIAFDTETIGLGHSAPLCGLSFAWKTGHGVYIPVASPQPQDHLDRSSVLEALRPLLENPAIAKIGHNLKYDLLVLRHAGVQVRGVAFDTMVAAHLLDLPSLGLDALAASQLQHEMIPISRLIGADAHGRPLRTMDQVALELIVPYAAEDSDMAWRLYEKFAPQLRILGMEPYAGAYEMPLVEVVVEMEFNGFRVDANELSRQQQGMGQRIAELRQLVLDRADCGPFNLDSPRQLADVLFNQLKAPVLKKTKSGPSTDIEVLEKLVDRDDLEPRCAEVVRLIVEYRQLTKLVGTYLEALHQAIDSRTRRVHATFHQTVTATGRLSSSGPNLQNIPIRSDLGREIRKAFVAEPEHLLISADYSQIELRVLAHLSQDPQLTAAFHQGLDIHTAVAAQVFGVSPTQVSREQRARAKIINFGIVYGVTPMGLVRRIEGLDLQGAKQLIVDYRQRYRGVDTFLQQCIQQAMTLGYVTTMHNRHRAIPQIRSGNIQGQRLGQRLAINSVVQGSAAELIKIAMVRLHHRIQLENLPMRLLLQIHDELVFEASASHAPAMARIIEHEMENALNLRVPLKAQAAIGRNWLEAK